MTDEIEPEDILFLVNSLGEENVVKVKERVGLLYRYRYFLFGSGDWSKSVTVGYLLAYEELRKISEEELKVIRLKKLMGVWGK